MRGGHFRTAHRWAAFVLWSTLLVACARNPVTGERELALISESQEIQMGQDRKSVV